MDVSLIICTRNRCSQLARCLPYVSEIAFDRPWELIIVDNGSTDETAKLVREFGEFSSVAVVYVFEPRPGLGNGHNAGVRIARGEILAFTDDDCYPASDFLEQIRVAFEDPSVGYITGRIMLHDPTDHPITTNESTVPRPFPKDAYLPAGFVQGANMAFRKRILVDIGGFDPWFGPGAFFNAEDVDAASRANAMGWGGQYRPEVIVRHHHGRKASDVPRLGKSYGIGRGAYHMKLLLHGEFVWFAYSMLKLPGRVRTLTLRSVLWEPVGAAQYGYRYVRRHFLF